MINDVLIAVLAALVGVAVGGLVVLRRQPQPEPDDAGAELAAQLQDRKSVV